ncbi:hypothetical protein ACFL12_07845 [Pseudomonadota bacterium]
MKVYEIMPYEIISFATSVFAVAISAGVAGWTIYRDMNDKGKLTLDCEVAFDMAELEKLGHGEHNPKLWLWMTISNVGRSPIAAKRITYQLGKAKGFGEATSTNYKRLPKMLGPGEYTVEKESADFALQEACSAICVYDTYGKKALFSGRRLEALKADNR